ncbi:DUF1540 domain-containing protein [Paenibacillus thermotolerans]|uniref:DUF1540 domain-containing protein n=1 Tax=Paenibacillus thermotolerans TaxID=3027807 RepID=UPI002368C7AE|nr:MULTISPECIES: DUF1540 domain-containing protein [unclassified Paenibacillus]
MPGVKCVVDTCTHYLYGDRCGAKNIDIMHEEETSMSQSVEQTMCKSFSHANGIANYLGSADNMNWGGTAMGLLNPNYEVSPSISCTVSSCKYWGEGAKCVAEAIEVTGMNSNECQDTNCLTFTKREGA